jgi:diguanylate cyclase (GGDEF)-like protein/PAS domain S-box-containing protein
MQVVALQAVRSIIQCRIYRTTLGDGMIFRHVFAHSLKGRITLVTLGIFLLSLWSLAFFASTMLRKDMQRVLGDAQFTTVSMVAAQINAALDERLRALKAYVDIRMTADMVAAPAAMQERLEGSPILRPQFNGGIFVTDASGTVIASVPVELGRIGLNHIENDSVAAALHEGKTGVSQPVIGKVLHAPVISMAAPVRDARGKVVGALVGITDLSKPNFLDPLTQARYGGTGGYDLVEASQRLVVTATDKSRIMEHLPALGANPAMDRILQGQDSYAVFVNSHGQEVLGSASQIKAANWLVTAWQPTGETFAPIRNMQERMLLITLLLTLAAGGLTWWLLHRQLAPLEAAAQALALQSERGQPTLPLVVVHPDEIGQLVGKFNSLLETVGTRELDLRESQARFKALADNASALVWMAGTDRLCHYFNKVWLDFTGRSAELEMGNGWAQGVHPDDLQRCLDSYVRAFDARKEFSMDYRLRRFDGEFRWLTDHGVPRYDDQGSFVGYIGTCIDITERKQMEASLRLTASVFAHAHKGISIADADGNIVDVNQEFSRITGYSRDDVIGRNSRILKSGRQSKEFYVEMWRELLESGHWSGEVWNRHKNGEEYPENLTISAVRDEQGQVQQFMALFSNISQRKQMEQQVHQLAFYDTLTLLPNRRLLRDRLNLIMAASKRSGLFAAVMFLDLDNFKPLNDLYGHDVGDLLLVEAARRMTDCVREADTVARFGGDEFVVILSELDSNKLQAQEKARTVAEKIRVSLSSPYQLALQQHGAPARVVEHHCSVSIGIVVFVNDEASQDEVLKWADAAMYQAKDAGRNSIRLHSVEGQS